MSDEPIQEISALIDAASATTPPLAPALELGGNGKRLEPRAWGYDPKEINKDHALVLWGGKAVVVKEQPTGPIEDRVRVLSIDAFDHWFSNRFVEIQAPDGRMKTTTWGKAWRGDQQRRQYAGIEFFPNPDGASATPRYLNLWRGFAVEPSEHGSWKIFRDHLFNNVCRGDAYVFQWVLGWFAHIIQRPRERIGTALVLRGRMGTGKTKVGEVIGSLVPSHYFQVDDPRYIVGHFNAHMASCLLLQAEEAVWAGDKQAEGRLKSLITSEVHMVEQKGIDAIRMRNFIRVLMTSNEDWVVPAGKGERRFCVLDIDPRCAQDHQYFREMDAELDAGGRARLLYDLSNFDLSSINLRSIPLTAALLEQKMRTLDHVDSWWLSRLRQGTQLGTGDDWVVRVACDELYKDYLQASGETGVKRRRDPGTFGSKMRQLVPDIVHSRRRAPDGKRFYCYEFPTLDKCREAFELQLGQALAWPAVMESDDDSAPDGLNAEVPV